MTASEFTEKERRDGAERIAAEYFARARTGELFGTSMELRYLPDDLPFREMIAKALHQCGLNATAESSQPEITIPCWPSIRLVKGRS